MSTGSIGVVFNPNSKRNRANPERFELLQELVGDQGVVRRTDHPDEVPAVIRSFLDGNVRWWVADGGDGAFHYLINKADQVLTERGLGEVIPPILPTNNGTINFLGSKANVVGRGEPLIEALVELIRAGEEPEVVAIDSLRLVGRYSDGSEFPGEVFEKVGFAAALAGVGQRFFDKFYANGRLNGLGIVEIVGKVFGSAFLNAPGVRILPAPTDIKAYSDSIFESQRLDVWIDGEKLPMKWFRALNAGSIDLDIVGVFHLFPHAAEPGFMHVQAGAPSVVDLIANLPRLVGGESIRAKNFFEQGARELRAVALDSYSIDPVIDGELFYGLRELTVTKGPPVQVISIQVKK